jgi:hypothetical protein
MSDSRPNTSGLSEIRPNAGQPAPTMLPEMNPGPERPRKRVIFMQHFQCGCEGEKWCWGSKEGRRHAKIGIDTTLAWSTNWHLTSTTKLVPNVMENKCVLGSFLWAKDLTKKVDDVFSTKLNGVAKKTIDENVPGFTNFRAHAEKAWASLQQPIPLGGGTNAWLVLAPSAIKVSPISGNGSVVQTSIGLVAQPRVLLDDKPNASQAPLPPLSESAPSSGIHVALSGELPYRELRTLLEKELIGRRYPATGKRYVTIRGVDIYGTERGVAVQVRVDGSAKGSMYLEGGLTYDGASDEIRTTDLEFTLDTRNVIVKTIDWLKHDQIRDAIRASARFSVRAKLTKLRETLSAALTQELAPGVKLDGAVNALRVTAVTTEADAIRFGVVADGHASLKL